MNSWSRTRKRIILSIVLLVLFILVGVPLFLLFYQSPTCTDGRRNGDESGIDCGGSCKLLCTPESLPLVIEGDPRILAVATSTYEVVAIFENPNVSAGIRRAKYVLKLFSSASLLPVKSIEGATYIPPGSRAVVFEGPFVVEEGSVPTRATIEWDESALIWERNLLSSPTVDIKSKSLSRSNSSPRLDVLVANPTLGSVRNLDLTALLYDESGSIFSASITFIEELRPGELAQAIFTWPNALRQEPVEIEIIPRSFPDRSYIK